jgi:queuine tRNA-ribosyltransferase
MAEFGFKITHQDKKNRVRTGMIHTRAGQIETPYFVPVGTLASVRSLDSRDLEDLGAQCALVNTYHLHLKPGDALIKKLGGIHKFMNFGKPVFSDSGGFQAFSLGLAREHNIGKIGFFPSETKTPKKLIEKAKLLEKVRPFLKKRPNLFKEKGRGNESLAKITDKGITFKSIYDGSWHFLDAKASMKIQSNLGTDIIMAFDECTSPLSDKDYTAKAMRRTHDWAKLSLKYRDKNQALYGIIQGGNFRDLRDESTQFIKCAAF